MPELVDKPQKEKFNYPGVFDRSIPRAMEVTPEPTVEDKPKPKPKKEKEVVTGGGKKLKLGKPKM